MKIFCRSSASNVKGNSLIWPKIIHVQDFMPVLVTCKFEEDLIRNEVVRTVTTFFDEDLI